MVKINITLTLSKVMAFYIVSLAFVLELLNLSSGVFYLALPIAASLVLGKQWFDKNKTTQDG